MDEKIKHFRDLRVWQKGIEIVKEIYRITNHYPKVENYGLSSQMRRSAISIPSNRTEGFKRFHNKEFRQFLFIASGSAAELETQLFISKELKYIDENEYGQLIEKIDHLCRMLSQLITKLI
ncbi:four helix bundle protein [bacterium]